MVSSSCSIVNHLISLKLLQLWFYFWSIISVVDYQFVSNENWNPIWESSDNLSSANLSCLCPAIHGHKVYDYILWKMNLAPCCRLDPRAKISRDGTLCICIFRCYCLGFFCHSRINALKTSNPLHYDILKVLLLWLLFDICPMLC